ncbi:unnamed protein product [Clonostachys rosea]|uniref:PNPLA domain-containing protein n=1 Tax=Bionectria ochroleuca TaxID=29856 RepID=A0ABY6V2Z7_BIOOC|nr:unnamed protein product [Clonostachys rosea]
MACQHMNKVPTLFRTWEASKNPGYNCKIWEAARATSAAPRLFKQICIGSPGRQVAFTDGALGCNNPVQYVLSEAKREFGEQRRVGCILSIGTGSHRSPGFDMPTATQRLLPRDLIHVLARLATDSNETANAMSERFHKVPNVYHRLNVGEELGRIGLDKCGKLGEIESHTMAYLRSDVVQRQLEIIVDAILGVSSSPVTFASLADEITSADGHHSPSLAPVQYQKYHLFPDLFTGETQCLHQKSMEEIDPFFSDVESGLPSQTLILYGMGGAGKTELALHYCRRARSSPQYQGAIFLDGTSRVAAQDSLIRAARTMCPGRIEAWTGKTALEEVSRVMANSLRPWLIVLDNYDDPTAYRVSEVVPRMAIGQLTIITSRSTDTKRIGIPIEIGELSEDEALTLLWGGHSGRTSTQRNLDDLSESRAIVERLGYLALAIAQASAYISDRHMELKFFLREYEEEQEHIHKALPSIWIYRRGGPNPETEKLLSIATTWELSLNLLKGGPERREAKIKLLALSAFLGKSEVSEKLFSWYMERCSDHPSWMIQFTEPTGQVFDRHIFREAIAEMGRLCLLQRYRVRDDGISWRFHPVVRDWAIHRHSEDIAKSFIHLAIQILQHSMGDLQPTWLFDDETEEQPQSHSQLRPHVRACYSNWQRLLGYPKFFDMPGGYRSALKFAKFFCSDGDYETAEQIQRGICHEVFPDSPPWSLTMRQLAKTLFSSGEWLQAARVQEQVVSKLVPGSEDLEGAFQLTELAYLYQWPSQRVSNQEELMARASELVSRGYAAITRLQGANSLAAASTMIVLAEIKYHSKDYAAALDLERRAVAIMEACLGNDNLTTARTRSSLGVTLAKLEHYAEAERIHLDVRAFHLKTLGPCHPNTMETERWLARDWRLSGKLGEARQLNEDILKRAVASFGSSHNDTKQAANALWRCLIAQREVDAADQLQREYSMKLKSVEEESRDEALRELGVATLRQGG